MLIWTGSSRTDPKSFLLLDRDGVINRDDPNYIKHWREVEIYPDALEALRWLKDRDIAVVLISNQSGLGRGIIPWKDFWEMHERMVAAIREDGGDLMAAFFCPHRPDQECSCRKPAPGMILTASRLFSIPLGRTFMIGDRRKDVEAMIRAGGRGVMVSREAPSAGLEEPSVTPSAVPVYPTLLSAVTALPWSEAAPTGSK
ncbi:MAG: D-glycero-alpha-D-manno-heptose-1,7-bisphosphate 7-phosphatase [Syntrophobacteraceae bacterium]